jgi:hypothetical protein
MVTLKKLRDTLSMCADALAGSILRLSRRQWYSRLYCQQLKPAELVLGGLMLLRAYIGHSSIQRLQICGHFGMMMISASGKPYILNCARTLAPVKRDPQVTTIDRVTR